jgi:hypothetical protein
MDRRLPEVETDGSSGGDPIRRSPLRYSTKLGLEAMSSTWTMGVYSKASTSETKG